jgi:hypothetical protein
MYEQSEIWWQSVHFNDRSGTGQVLVLENGSKLKDVRGMKKWFMYV